MAILKAGGYAYEGVFVSVADELKQAIAGTVSYPPDEGPPSPKEDGFPNVDGFATSRNSTAIETKLEVENETTFAGARRIIHDGGRPCVLNFASATEPGGGFLSGAQAQEEFLARCSGLYPCIQDNSMYPYHRGRMGSLYTDYVLYSPSVPVFRDDDEELTPSPFLVGIVTAAAVNRSGLRSGEVTEEEILSLMTARIDKVLSVMRFHGHREIVLGAWGCGVFGNDPRTMAELFRDALERRHQGAFSRVVFSVLDYRPGQPVFSAFDEVFSHRISSPSGTNDTDDATNTDDETKTNDTNDKEERTQMTFTFTHSHAQDVPTSDTPSAPEAPISRLAELTNLILKAKQAYYFGDTPIMDDAAYDALEEELARLEPDHPLLKTVGAPVPADAILTKANHRIPMGSQSKVNSIEEFEAWYAKSAEGGAVHVSLKGDGASAAAYYVDGFLVQAISRGDGSVGEDITANAMKFRGLPAYVESSRGRFNGAVRMEVILTIEAWGKVDPEMQKNPRNLGNGMMGRKNGVGAEHLTAYAFDLSEDGVEFPSEHAKITRLEALGFQVIPNELCRDAAACIAHFEHIKKNRSGLPFWIDGVVLKVDDLAHQLSLGATGGRPKGQVAWKFESEGAETEVLGVVLSGGHTGSIIPTAQLSPVDIGGTTVSNALLNNWEEIQRLGVAIGDIVFVIKANDIIPKVIEVRRRAPDGKRKLIEEPTACPFCGGAVARRTNTGGEFGAITVCLNEDCEKKSDGKINRWIRSLDIQGVGDSVRQAMIEQLGLADPSDLYRLRERRDALINLIINKEKDIRLGEKRADGVLEAIEGSRNLSLIDFLGSLGVDGLGKRRVELMVKAAGGKLDTLEAWQSGALRDGDFAASVGVPSIGGRLQDDLDASGPLIDRLLANGVVVSPVERSDADEAAEESAVARTLCITGKLPSGKKKSSYEEDLKRVGIKLVDQVTPGLDFLVVSNPSVTSAKTQKAQKHGVRIIDEDELQKLLE